MSARFAKKLVVSFVVAGLVSLAAGALALRLSDDGSSKAEPPWEVFGRQRELLLDGLVTRAEYEEAVSLYLECGRAAGFTPQPVAGEGLRTTQVGFRIPDADGIPDAETVRDAQAKLAECSRMYLDEVSGIWEGQKQTPGAAALSLFYDALNACVAAGGRPEIPVPKISRFTLYEGAPATSIAVKRADRDAYVQCALALEAETGLVAPPPAAID